MRDEKEKILSLRSLSEDEESCLKRVSLWARYSITPTRCLCNVRYFHPSVRARSFGKEEEKEEIKYGARIDLRILNHSILKIFHADRYLAGVSGSKESVDDEGGLYFSREDARVSIRLDWNRRPLDGFSNACETRK